MMAPELAVCAPKNQSRFLRDPAEDSYHKTEVGIADFEKGKALADDNHMALSEQDEDHEYPTEAHRQEHEDGNSAGCSYC